MPPKAAPKAADKAKAPAAKAPPAKDAKAAAPAAKAAAPAAKAKDPKAAAKDAKGGAKDAKAKDAKGKAADPKAAAAGAKDAKAKAPAGKADPGKAFPLEKGPTPSKMEPTDITRLYKLPDGEMKTEEDVITKQGYALEEKLGQGGFGTVFLARDKKKNIKVACKLCELGKEWSDARVKDMKNELFIHEKIKHLYVVKLFLHFLTQSSNGNRLYLFMELADGGDFSKFCAKKGMIPEKEAKLYYAQIACGVNHMHSLGIAHRDIKLQNVLLAKCPTSISGDFTCLLADFGLSRLLHHEGAAVALQKTVCGTPLFMSPELQQKKPYNGFEADVWALGITIYIMMTTEVPFDFKNMAAAKQAMLDKKWSWPEEKMKEKPSGEVKELLTLMLEPVPEKRIKMPEMLAHKWVDEAFKKAQDAANKAKPA